MLIETDCPYLTPHPFRGKRNEPSYVKLVAEEIANLKGISYEEVAEMTTKNAKVLFGVEKRMGKPVLFILRKLVEVMKKINVNDEVLQ